MLKLIFPVILMFANIIGIIIYYDRVTYLVSFISLVLIILSFVWYWVRNLSYSLMPYIAYDNPNMNSLEVVNESERMMKGNRGKIFLLSLSFIGWAILAVFTLGIGYLWLMPYMMVAEVCFYEHLLGKKEQGETESNVDAIKEM